VGWPRFGLSAEEAVSLIEEESNNGSVPVLADSVYCYRHMQADGYPVRVLAVRDPAYLIGLVPAGSLMTASSSQASTVALRLGYGSWGYSRQRLGRPSTPLGWVKCPCR
jgi:hypothetical protein